MRRWQGGPALALLLLIGIGAYGAWSSPSPQTVSDPDKAAQQRTVPKLNKPEPDSPLVVIAVWASNNKDSIDPLAAIGALVAAGVLAVVTGFLWGATKSLAKSTEDLAIAATGQSGEMALARDVAERQLDLTRKRFSLTGEQADLAIKQHGLQRLQFYAEYRPRLILKEVFFTRANDFGSLTYELANTGGSPATITGGFVALDFVTNFRQFKAIAGGSLGRAFRAEIKDGWVEQFIVEVPSQVQLHLEHPNLRRIRNLDDPQPPLGDLYFFGILSYADGKGDEFGTVRGSVFRRKWDGFQFQRTDDPDHEHAH